MRIATVLALLLAPAVPAWGAGPVQFQSPGLPPSTMDPAGRLVEDWGTLGVKLAGEGVAEGPTTVEAVRLDSLIPAARATADRGAVRLLTTAYRAPAHPAGVDVFSVRVEEAKGRPAKVTLALDVPKTVRAGLRTARLGSRVVLTLADEALEAREIAPWGACDESVALPGWAKPAVKCDPAFRNIRAGMGGVPIRYRFTVQPRSEAVVVLGLCESHWDRAAQRPVVCRVEGAEPLEVDPIARWGRHKPGALVFRARDENGDGRLDIAVRAAPGAKDRNPILNAIWIFPPGEIPNLGKVIAGALNTKALRYVDVGGPGDQSLYPPGKLEYQLSLPAGGSKTLVFFVACQGGSAPIPEVSPWTAETLRRAAWEVARDWHP
jgi:hypothetical protein